MWRLIHHPTSATISDIMKLVFSPSTTSFKSRYYVNLPPSKSSTTTTIQANTESSEKIKTQTAYQNIKDILHSKKLSASTREPASPTQTFEKLPDEIEFIIDKSATVQVEDEGAIPCPDTVEEALFLVSKARQKAATHSSFVVNQISRTVDQNGFEVYSINRSRK